MPSKQRLGRDHEDRSSGPGQKTTERRQQRTVPGLEPRPWVLTVQNCQLVAEDHDLHLFRVRRPPAEHHQLKDTARLALERDLLRSFDEQECQRVRIVAVTQVGSIL